MFTTNELITDSEILSNYQDDQTEKEGNELSKNIALPLPLSLDQSPKEEEKDDSSINSDSEATNYCEAITSLSNFDIRCKDPHSELFKILKKVNRKIYIEVLKKINPDCVVNRLVRKITKERKNRLKKALYEPSDSKIHYPKASELEAPHLPHEIKIAIKKYRRQQWEEEFKGTFIYREGKHQSFTKQYEKLSKDKSSLWFDSDQYKKIKGDYEYIRREWQNRESKSKRKDNDQATTIEIQSKDIQLGGIEETKTEKGAIVGVDKKAICKTSLKSYEIDPSCISNPAGIRKSRMNTFGEQRESLFAIDQMSIDQHDREDNDLTETDRGTNYGFMPGAACLSSEINAPSPPTSDIDKRDGDSNPSKTLGSLSESTKTPGNGPNGRHEFRVVENLLSNIFTKLSPFSDVLGRRLIFEVDWDYLDRKWEITHSTIKDEFNEKILAISLQPQIIEPTEESSSIRNLQNNIEDELSEILNKSILIPHLLNKEYGEEESSEDQILNFYSNSKTKLNFSDKFDKNWDKRKSLLKFVRPEDAFECEWITPGGSFYGRIYIIYLQSGSKMFYFRSKETSDEETQDYTEVQHPFRSILQQRRVFKKEFLFEVTEVIAKNYLCVSNSIEIYDSNSNQYYFFNFFDNKRQLKILDEMKYHCTSVIQDCAKEFHKRKYTEKWKNQRLSSFDYLLLINKFSSRSFNDLSQYPMMPWVGP